ncbi:MAG: hypothetical protein ACREIC_11085, partial [Limisphaerales bacterium]
LALLLLLIPGCQPNKEVQALLEPSQALGEVLAEETLRLAGANRSITLITHDSSWGPPSTAEQALRAALKKEKATLDFVKTANLGNPMLSGEVGLKAADFFEAMEKSTKAGAVISLVGAPLLNEGDLARLMPAHPPVLVVATASLGDKMGVHTDPVRLASLIEAKVIQLAIIDGDEPTAQPTAKPDPNRALFAQHYRILRSAE